MTRYGSLHCRRISDEEFSLKWDFKVVERDSYLSPECGPECGIFSNCRLRAEFFQNGPNYRRRHSYVFRINLLPPVEVVKNCPKITYSARLFSGSGAELTSRKSETGLMVTHCMTLIDNIHYHEGRRFYLEFSLVLVLRLFDETAGADMSSCAKNIDFCIRNPLKIEDFLVYPSVKTWKEVKNENNCISETANGRYNVKYPEYLIHDLRSLYNSGLMSDIDICIGGKTLRAHKLILCARSPVFQKMMEHEFVESTQNCIDITDCEPEIFQKFLKYLYTGEMDDKTTNTVMELYTLADKYDVKGLRISCSEILQSVFSTASVDPLVNIVVDVLQLAERHSDSKLKGRVMSFIVDHFPEVTSKENWKEFLRCNSELTSEVLAQVAVSLRNINSGRSRPSRDER